MTMAEGTTHIDLELLHVLAGQAGMALEQRILVEQVLVNSRLAAMGETVAAISHGIKNILQGLRGGTDAVAVALQKDDLEMAGRGWNVLARNLDRIQSLTMNMLGFVRSRAFDIERVNFEELMTEVSELLVSQTTRADVRLEMTLSENTSPGAPGCLSHASGDVESPFERHRCDAEGRVGHPERGIRLVRWMPF